jgi:hypothetical protein
MKSEERRRNFFLHRRPQGNVTRGKTAPNRLRRADILLYLYDPFLLSKEQSGRRSLYVDIGYGENPLTTLETRSFFSKLYPYLSYLGVEINPERVAKAEAFKDYNLFFRHGGFNLPLQKDESVNFIRAFNVLRQYSEDEVTPAYDLLSSYLVNGGLLLDGTSNPSGSIWTANLIRKLDAGYAEEALVFSFSFKQPFSPDVFPPYLIKKWIHRMGGTSPIYDFFECYRSSYKKSFLSEQGYRKKFVKTAFYLHEAGYRVSLSKRFLSRGYLVWQYPK